VAAVAAGAPSHRGRGLAVRPLGSVAACAGLCLARQSTWLPIDFNLSPWPTAAVLPSPLLGAQSPSGRQGKTACISSLVQPRANRIDAGQLLGASKIQFVQRRCNAPAELRPCGSAPPHLPYPCKCSPPSAQGLFRFYAGHDRAYTAVRGVYAYSQLSHKQ